MSEKIVYKKMISYHVGGSHPEDYFVQFTGNEQIINEIENAIVNKKEIICSKDEYTQKDIDEFLSYDNKIINKYMYGFRYGCHDDYNISIFSGIIDYDEYIKMEKEVKEEGANDFWAKFSAYINLSTTYIYETHK